MYLSVNQADIWVPIFPRRRMDRRNPSHRDHQGGNTGSLEPPQPFLKIIVPMVNDLSGATTSVQCC